LSDTTAAPSGTGPGDDELAALVKADLHVHLVGSAAPRTVAALAARHPGRGVPADVDELRAFFAFRDFAHFLSVYTAVSDLVRTPDDVVTLVLGLAEDMRAQGTVYAEVTVTPVSHLKAGIRAGELAQALDIGAAGARAQSGIELAWVYDISGGDGREGAQLTLQRITLEICPSSNVATGVVPALAAHPLPRLLTAGVPVVLGSDDPPMFGTTLLDEYRRARDHFGLTAGQIHALARASIDASFAPAILKQRLLGPQA
jgi:adenosine deaminase